jgi:hypothetical protein
MKLSCQDEIGISPTFNVSDLYPYKAEEVGAASDTRQASEKKDQAEAILRVSGQMEEPPSGRCQLGD